MTGVESPSASMVEEKEDRLEAAPTPQEEVVTKKEWVGEGRKTGGGAEAAKGEVATAGEPTTGGGADAAEGGVGDGGGAETAGE